MYLDSIVVGPRNKAVKPELVSIIVCTYNRADTLDGALTSLKDQQIAGELSLEILVIDDGSTDSTQRVVAAQQDESIASIRYLRQEHAGVAAARNRGVKEALGDWIAFFDDDQIAEINWLSELMDRAAAEGADCVGGPCMLRVPSDYKLQLDPTIRRLLGEEPLMMKEQGPLYTGLDPRKRGVLPGTGNALIRKALFARVGLFTESRSYGEDFEFFRRAQRVGARFAIAPRAVVYHIVPLSRLTENYLLRAAALGGQAQAEVAEYKEAIWTSFLRLSHLLIVAGPRLCSAFLAGDRARMLARKCSIRFSLEYIAVALQRSRRRHLDLAK